MLASASTIEDRTTGRRAIVMAATFGSFLLSLDEANELITALALARLRALDPTPLPEAPPRPFDHPRFVKVASTSLEDLS